MIKYIFSFFLIFSFLISSDEKSSFDTSEVTYQAEKDSEKEANSKPMATWSGGSSFNKKLIGKHHEVYLSDIRRAAPEKWNTIIRQPMS